MPFTPLVSAEGFIRDWLAAQFAPTRVVTELPANLADVVPLLQVTRFGGQDDFITLDAANIDIDAFAVGRDAARTLAEQARTAVRLHLPGYASGGAAVQSVTTISAPRWVPYDNTSLRRFVASYRITIHSIPT
jgi:hypothetical protein